MQNKKKKDDTAGYFWTTFLWTSLYFPSVTTGEVCFGCRTTILTIPIGSLYLVQHFQLSLMIKGSASILPNQRMEKYMWINILSLEAPFLADYNKYTKSKGFGSHALYLKNSFLFHNHNVVSHFLGTNHIGLGAFTFFRTLPNHNFSNVRGGTNRNE